MKIVRIYKQSRLAALVAGCFLMFIVENFQFILSKGLDLHEARGWRSLNQLPLLNSDSSSLHSESNNAPKHGCSAHPNLEEVDVVVVVKTGATEAYQKLPMQLLTFLSCAKDRVLIFSDMEQKIAGYHVYDALADVADASKLHNSDFELYQSQKQYKFMGESIAAMGDRGKEAWTLDKYKNIHTAQKAWELQPDRSWYLFIDTDTYVFWSSFTAWLKGQDPNKKFYLGSQVDTKPPFAHGGSGYVLSRGAMKELVGKDSKDVAENFDVMVKDDCCGDAILARSLNRKKISLTNWYPLINGEKARKISFGPKIWCQPVITFHHMVAEEINEMWQFEQRRANLQEPLLFKELYSAHLEPAFAFAESRENWDNLSKDIIYRAGDTENLFDPYYYAYKSLGECKRACKGTEECFQYLWDGQSCKLGKSFKLGGLRETAEGDVKFSSGWDLGRIRKWVVEQGDCAAPLWKSHHAD